MVDAGRSAGRERVDSEDSEALMQTQARGPPGVVSFSRPFASQKAPAGTVELQPAT